MTIPWRQRRRLKLMLAAVMLAALYWSADWRAVGHAVLNLAWRPLGWGVALFVPQIVVAALRWRALVRSLCRISRLEAVRQIFIAAAFNLILPSKIGELSKATLLPLERSRSLFEGGLRVAMEKGSDVLALAAIWLAGSVRIDGASWCLVLSILALFVAIVGRSPVHAVSKGYWALLSLSLWSLHIWQIQFFFRAADLDPDWQTLTARVPAALFAGLLPFTPWGLGTRDTALVWLFREAPASQVAVVGMLTSLRYLLPGLCGIPLVLGRPFAIGDLQQTSAGEDRNGYTTLDVASRNPDDPSRAGTDSAA